ncbi:MAG: DNA/RNA nuclease SfsA, partial [Lachnospiraceae bacterium]|nr:DNA/RNA nuclease SfsA [Lachnospiraceae bacterium]
IQIRSGKHGTTTIGFAQKNTPRQYVYRHFAWLLQSVESRGEDYDKINRLLEIFICYKHVCSYLHISKHWEPNWVTHEAFGEALCRAKEAGVRLLAYDCLVTEDSMQIDASLPIVLTRGDMI